MARFSEAVSSLFGRVELLALGAEDDRREASLALSRGDFLAARAHAKSLLARVPGSKIGLALLADAAEGAGLAEEAALALEPLAEAMPWRADPWLRLSQARRDAGLPEGAVGEALERAARAPEGDEARRQALLELCDLDLLSNDPARASRWLDRVGSLLEDPEVLLRKAEHALAIGDMPRAREAISHLSPAAASDGRRALVIGRVRAHEGDASAFDWLLRAFVLEAPGASSQLSAYVAECRDAVLVGRARAVVRAAGAFDEPRWAWAFALSEGRGEDARRALWKGAKEGDPEAVRALLAWALHAQDRGALADAMEALTRTGQHPPAFAQKLAEALAAHARGDDGAALDALDAIPEGPGAPWRDELRASWMRLWLPEEGEANWPALLGELQRGAKRLSRFDALSAIEAIAIERERPLRVAVLGEFNAGKSTFLNALLGEDVAPTGILPTTATLHWLSWAADSFARILVRGAADRVVTHAELKRTLRELSATGSQVEKVLLHAPIELLRRIELLDTPGLNSGDVSHTESARMAFEEAHIAIWLLDASQPLKESERAILAELRRMEMPAWVLLNKRDRLSEEQLSLALAHVNEGLGTAGLFSYAKPLAFSAKEALSGRLGDEEALSKSGWEAVEEVLDRIVANSVPLRERALRRRAQAIVTMLVTEARPRVHAEEQAEVERQAWEQRLVRAASLLEGAVGDVRSWATISEASKLLFADLKPLFDRPATRGETIALSEGALRYAIDRAVFRLAEPLLVTCLRIAKLEDADPGLRENLSARLASLVAGAMAMACEAHSQTPDPKTLVMAALPIVARALRETLSKARPASEATALAARLTTLRVSLSCGEDRDGSG